MRDLNGLVQAHWRGRKGFFSYEIGRFHWRPVPVKGNKQRKNDERSLLGYEELRLLNIKGFAREPGDPLSSVLSLYLARAHVSPRPLGQGGTAWLFFPRKPTSFFTCEVRNDPRESRKHRWRPVVNDVVLDNEQERKVAVWPWKEKAPHAVTNSFRVPVFLGFSTGRLFIHHRSCSRWKAPLDSHAITRVFSKTLGRDPKRNETRRYVRRNAVNLGVRSTREKVVFQFECERVSRGEMDYLF